MKISRTEPNRTTEENVKKDQSLDNPYVKNNDDRLDSIVNTTELLIEQYDPEQKSTYNRKSDPLATQSHKYLCFLLSLMVFLIAVVGMSSSSAIFSKNVNVSEASEKLTVRQLSDNEVSSGE